MEPAALRSPEGTAQPGCGVLPIIREIRRSGATSLHQIADALNARGISTPRGGAWYAKSVSNVLAHSRT
jgi:hypothetical protein